MASLDAHMHKINVPYTPIVASESVFPFVPCLDRPGYVGMWRSMLRIWRISKRECPHEWTIILESDARPPLHFVSRLERILRPPRQVVWFDQRIGVGPGPSGCCTNVVAYHRSVLPGLISQFNPHNRHALWNGYDTRQLRVVKDSTCLTDWYLGNVVAEERWQSYRAGMVAHGSGQSEIALVGRVSSVTDGHRNT